MRYELIREIFNQCSNNQMRDVFVSEVETEDTDRYMTLYWNKDEGVLEKQELDKGVICYDLWCHGLHQRFSFTPDD